MLVHEMNRTECIAVLQRNRVGRLGYAHFEQPCIVPIQLFFDAARDQIYGFSMVGEKVSSMRRNPRVCVEVDEIVDKDHWATVLVLGRYREIHRDPREAEALGRAERLFRERDEWWLPGAAACDAKEHDHAVVYRITVDRLTGRRAARNRLKVPALPATA